MKRLCLAVVALAAATAHADENGLYTNQQLMVHIEVPKGWELRGQDKAGQGTFYKGWNDTIAEIRAKNGHVGGIAFHVKSTWTVEQCADGRVEQLAKICKAARKAGNAQKLTKGGGGTWLRQDYELDFADGSTFHHAHVYAAKGGEVLELMMWSSKAMWNDETKAEFDGVFDALTFGELPAPPTKAKVPANQWKGFGVGSSVTYKMVSETSGAKTEMTMSHLLKKQGDTSYTVQSTTEMPGYKGSSTVIYEVEAPAAGGGGGDAKVEKGHEKITTPAGDFDCEWVKSTTAQGWSKTWLSDKVPGQMVKSESEMGPTKSTMVLTAFTKK